MYQFELLCVLGNRLDSVDVVTRKAVGGTEAAGVGR
jgi:hypothetical protein